MLVSYFYGKKANKTLGKIYLLALLSTKYFFLEIELC